MNDRKLSSLEGKIDTYSLQVSLIIIQSHLKYQDLQH